MENLEHPTCGSDYAHVGAARPASRALLLCNGKPSSDDRNITILLDFFGIPWKVVSISEMTGGVATTQNDHPAGFCLMTSASCMAAAVQINGAPETALPAWISNASSVYVYGFQETALCRGLLRFLTSAPDAEIRKLMGQAAHLAVTSDFPEMCGPMSGICASLKVTENDFYFDFRRQAEKSASVISADCGDIFVSAIRGGVRFFLNACSGTIDISSPATKYFDVKEYYCSAVPIVMYLKWAFADVCWRSTETQGCLIVDDPLLKPRYGFLRFSDTLQLMDSHNFTTTIAFIPWNWRRTNRHTVRQFQLRADRLSLCVHGCDHTASEFAARSTAVLNRRIKTASQRMEMLFQRTSLPHDDIMVFPQGAFSPEVGRALKLNGFTAAVNTEVAPSDDARNDTKIADLWDVAIMKYGTFPIYTRRYITHGIENFAFDALLGKPCLIVAHHEAFRDRGRELTDFIGRLNSLKWNLHWGSLGDVIINSFKIRKSAGGIRRIQMYAEQLIFENSSTEPREVIVIKEESDPDCVNAVKVNGKTIQHNHEDNHLHFRMMMPPGEKIEIRVTYFDQLDLDSSSNTIAYNFKTRARRHLSELRDNYLSQSRLLHATATKIKRFLN